MIKLFEKIESKDITMENALLFAKFNPERALEIAEILEKKGWYELIPDVFKIAPKDALRFVYTHQQYAADLALLMPKKIDEIINIIELPKDQLIKLAVKFPEKIINIVRINPDTISEIFFETMHYSVNEIKAENAKQKYDIVQTKISEVGQEFPDKIMPILKQVDKFRNKCNEAEEIIISTAKFFPQKATEIALTYNLELKVAIAVPSIAAKIALEKPELAFEIMKEVPASEKEIKEHFTIKKH